MSKKNVKLDNEVSAMVEEYQTSADILEELSALKTEVYDEDPEFVAGCLKAQLVEEILCAMDEQGVSKSQLAQRLGKSRQYVGRILNETANFTIDSIAQLLCALNCDIKLTISLKEPSCGDTKRIGGEVFEQTQCVAEDSSLYSV